MKQPVLTRRAAIRAVVHQDTREMDSLARVGQSKHARTCVLGVSVNLIRLHVYLPQTLMI